MLMGGARPCSTAGSSTRSRPALHVPRDGPVSNFSTSMGRTNTTRVASARSPLSCTRTSENPDDPDGGQLRDFVWLGDCVQVALWALQEPGAQSGLYNVGSGTARAFLEMAKIMFAEMGVAPDVEFIDLPAA